MVRPWWTPTNRRHSAEVGSWRCREDTVTVSSQDRRKWWLPLLD